MKATIRTLIMLTMFQVSSFAVAQCVAGFSFVQGSNGQVIFTNTSAGTTSTTLYSWLASNGATGNSNTFTCNFTDNQVYTVKLDIADSSSSPTCFSTITQTVGVSTAPCSQSLSISSSQSWNYQMNLSINAAIPISGGYTFTWTLGDGTTINNGGIIASHTYSSAGVYTVSVIAQSFGNNCTYTASAPVTVSLITCPLNASFTYSAGSGNGLVHFTSTSTGTTGSTAYTWYFGDGQVVYSGGPTISHNYAANGNFQPNLSISDSANTWGLYCMDSTMQNISISNFTCMANSSFILHKDSSQAFHWFIFPTYAPNVVAASWNWGDGSSSNSLYPSHTFSAAGMYNICLSVTVNCGATFSTCVNSNIFRGSSPMIGVTVIDPNGPTALKERDSGLLNALISPNPNSGRFKISGEGFGSTTRVEVHNNLGQLVLTNNLLNESGQMWVDASELPPGAYFIKIESAGKNKTCRVILTRD